MSTLTDVLNNPASAAAELTRLRASVTALEAQNAILAKRNRELSDGMKRLDTLAHAGDLKGVCYAVVELVSVKAEDVCAAS